MAETPRIVTRTRRVEPETKNFQFNAGMIPATQSQVLQEYRSQAWETFEKLPIPTPGEEAWRRTDIKALKPEIFRLPRPDEYLDLAPVPDELLQPIADDPHGGEIILLPGGTRVELREEWSRLGVVFTDFQTALDQHPDLMDRLLGKVVRPRRREIWRAHCCPGANRGGSVCPERRPGQPAASQHLVEPRRRACSPLTRSGVDRGRRLGDVYSSTASPTETGGRTLHSGIVEIYVGAGANLRFVELQSLGENVWNFTHERAKVDRDATFEWIFGAMGSRLTKNFSDLDLIGSGSTGKMSGFYFTDNNQHLDHDTQQNHLAPSTTSDLLFKGALQGESRSVWQGMIYVAPGALKTDGYQANRNLVLSSKARRIDPWPGNPGRRCTLHPRGHCRKDRPGPGILPDEPGYPG